LAPIEVFFGAIVLIFTLIGLARGFLRELGVTTVMMFLLFFLSRFEPQLDKGMVKIMSANLVSAGDKDLWQCGLFLFVIAAAAFVSYQGETLSFGGQPPRRSCRTRARRCRSVGSRRGVRRRCCWGWSPGS
jgi:hypothetical protein